MIYLDKHFVGADLILRRGGHINRSLKKHPSSD